MLTVQGLEIPHDVHRLERFREWVASFGEGAPRVSFCQGRVNVEMTPQDYRTHEPLVAAINGVLGQLARDENKGRYFMPPSWFTHEPSGLSTEPDGFLVKWETFTSGGVQLRPERTTELVGRPDLAVEVVSKTSARKDLVDLVQGYAAAGVPEYWIADGRQEKAELRILVLTGDAFEDAPADSDGWVASPFWKRRFKLARYVNPAGWPDFRRDVAPLA